MVMEVIAGLIIFAAISSIGTFLFGFLGASAGIIASSKSKRELSGVVGTWIGVALFWILAVVVALVVAL